MEILIQLAEFILNNVLNILGLAQFINGNTQHAAQESTPRLIQTNTKNAIDDLDNITYGLFALHNQLTAIKTAVDAITPGLTPVVLPTTPPTGYGGTPADETAAAVWNYPWGEDEIQTGQWLQRMSVKYLNTWELTDTLNYLGWFWPMSVRSETLFTSYPVQPVFDPTDILPGETSLDCLTRQNPDATCGWWDIALGHVSVGFPGDPSVKRWLSRFSDAQFQETFVTGLVPATSNLPPVWPGLEKVTLGDPVSIDTGLTIAVPMDGCLIAITAVPGKQGQFDFDTAVSWRNIGALSFYDDNGDQEFPQTLGFTNCVYCPTSMSTASGLRLRTTGGVVGTVTPWTRAT